MITVEVVYARPDNQVLMTFQVSTTTTVMQAIQQSGILERFPEIDLLQSKVGIFSKIVPLSTLLNQGDRIEIYRPLQIDPKQARLLRAARVKKQQKKL